MALEIKYIENNLIKNVHDEWWAYYRVAPYDYSFTSYQDKTQFARKVQQVIAQTRTGQIHMLEISTEESVRASQERSKAYVSGVLRDVALEKIDRQTQVLVDGDWLYEPENVEDEPYFTGETQIDYQYYIGFQLIPSEDAGIKEKISDAAYKVLSVLNEFQKKAIDDYEIVPDNEYERYRRLDGTVYDKLSKHFAAYRLNVNEMGYIISHLNGASGTAYRDYDYYLPLEKVPEGVRVKRYNIMKLGNVLIEEYPKHMLCRPERENTFCAYLTVGDVVADLEFPGSEILYYQQSKFDFPIDTSIRVEVIQNLDAIKKVRNQKKTVTDMDEHAYNSGNESSNTVFTTLEETKQLEGELEATKESMYYISYILRVTAKSKSELQQRCIALIDYYDSFGMKLVRPVGDMMVFHGEFMPGAKRRNVIRHIVKSDWLACLGFGASQIIGEPEGIAIGYGSYSGRMVYLKPWLAAQGVPGSVTNSPSCAFVGAVGGGKSLNKNLLAIYSVMFGAQAVFIDPKSERGNWKEDLPELAHEINIVNLTTDVKNKGILDPFIVMKRARDRESLAMDITTYLLGVSIRDGERYPRLRNAIRIVSEQENPGMLLVIEQLRRDSAPEAQSMANHLESFTDSGLAQLLFSDGNVENSITLEKRINVIQVADLVMPDKDTKPEDYTSMEMLSVAMLLAISTFCLDFIKRDRETFKIVDLDEAWSILNVSQGKLLCSKLVRTGRALNAGIFFGTTNIKDVDVPEIRNNMGMYFIFRSNDIDEIKKSLEVLGVDSEDENNQAMIRELKNGECVMKDIYGHVNVVKFEYLMSEFKHAFDTRPGKRR